MQNQNSVAKYNTIRAWHARTWQSGSIGKLKVAGSWCLIALAIAVPVAALQPDVQLELRTDLKEPALLCLQQKSIDTIINVQDPTNEALVKKYRSQPEILTRIMTNDGYMQRSMWAYQQETLRQLARGNCVQVSHSDPVTARWLDWPPRKDEGLGSEPERMQVTYKGQKYWTYAGEWQEANGTVVPVESRAPLLVSRKSGADAGALTTVAPAAREPAVAHKKGRPIPPFSRNETYAAVRTVLMRDGWQPVLSKDADTCMDGDSRCEGRPEMLTCSGSGLAMCRFGWQRDSEQLTICTAGEEQAMFHSVCN
ncbi:hypothetical protein ACCQ08_19945 [Comamonas sp. SY3]|uniref:hypothetical protein n=1 Tax=Comamonas sp. SY3 TaxID=3243601 RepID=UPI003593435F